MQKELKRGVYQRSMTIKNIYTEALKNVSCVDFLTDDDFSEPALSSAKSVIAKGADLYKLLGRKVILMAHSDQFKSTPNEISWYTYETDHDRRINYIYQVDHDYVKENLDNDMYEEIIFYVSAAKTSK